MGVDEFFRRYDQARGEMSELQVVKLAGIGKDALRNGRRRGAAPDLLSVIKVAKVLDVPPFHFLEPLGVTRELLEETPSGKISSQVIDDPDEIALIGLWRDIGKPQRPMILKMMRGLLADVA